MELLHKPWVWIVGLLIGAMLLMGGRRGASTSNLTETNAIAADTNVKLSSISAGAASSTNALRAHMADLAAAREDSNLNALRTGLSSSNQILLQHVQAKSDETLAHIAAESGKVAESTRLAIVKSNNATTLALGQIQGRNQAAEIRAIPFLAQVQANVAYKIELARGATVQRVEKYRTDATIQQARYNYKAAKARASADEIGAIAGAVGSVASAYAGGGIV